MAAMQAGMAPIMARARSAGAFVGRGMTAVSNFQNPIASAIRNNFHGLLAGTGLVAMGRGMSGILGESADIAGGIEAQKMGLRTLLHGNKSKANEVFENIKTDALRTPFNIEGIAQADRFMIGATRGDTDKARATVLDLGNAVTASGRGDVEFRRMAYNMQDIANKGEADKRDIKQFGTAGIDLTTQIAKAYGIKPTEVYKYKITFDVIAYALKKAGEAGGDFYRGYENFMESAKGKAERFSENLELMKSNFGELVNEGLKPMYDISTKMFYKMNTFMGSEGGKTSMGIMAGVIAGGSATLILAGIVTIIGAIGPALAAILPIALPLVGVMATLGKSLGLAFAGMANVDKFLDGGAKGTLANTTANRYAAYLMAVKDMINLTQEGNFRVSSDTMKVFTALGMGNSDIEGIAKKVIAVKDFFRGLKDGVMDVMRTVKSILPSEGLFAEMFGFNRGTTYDSAKSIVKVTSAILGLGIAFAIAMSPVARLTALFFLMESAFSKIGLEVNPKMDAMRFGLVALAFQTNFWLGVLVLVSAVLSKIAEKMDYIGNKWNEEHPEIAAERNKDRGRFFSTPESKFKELSQQLYDSKATPYTASGMWAGSTGGSNLMGNEAVIPSSPENINLTVQIGDTVLVSKLISLLKQANRKEEQ
jgi:hypothetical protein